MRGGDLAANHVGYIGHQIDRGVFVHLLSEFEFAGVLHQGESPQRRGERVALVVVAVRVRLLRSRGKTVNSSPADVATELGATRQPEPGRHSWDYEFHPQYRVDWEIEKGIEIEGE